MSNTNVVETNSLQTWNNSITSEQRSSLTRKITKTFLDVHRERPFLNLHLHAYDIIQYSIQIEFEIFTTSNNLEEYCRSLAERIYSSLNKLRALTSTVNVNLFNYLRQRQHQQQIEYQSTENNEQEQSNSNKFDVTKKIRKYLIKQLISTILTQNFNGKGVNLPELVQHATKIEKKVYKKSQSKEEYFHLLTEYIYKTRKLVRRIEREQYDKIIKNSFNSFQSFNETIKRD